MLGRLGAFGLARPDRVGHRASANTGNSILHLRDRRRCADRTELRRIGARRLGGRDSGNEWVPPGTDVTWFWDAAAELAVELLPPRCRGSRANRPEPQCSGAAANEIEVRWARLATFGQTRRSSGDDVA
jgi:hypothetical protein